MLIGAFVVAADRLEAAGQPTLSDAVSDPATCALRLADVDGFAAQHGGEHRPDGNRSRGRGLARTVESVIRATIGSIFIGQSCQQIALTNGVDKNACCPERLGLSGEQSRFLIYNQNALAYISEFSEYLLQSEHVFEIP